MSSKKSKTDLLVRQRFQNPLPAPAFPPKLLTIKTDPSRYASYDFLVPLFMERPIPMLVDAEGGMPLDQNLVPGYWDSKNQGRDGKMCPDINALDVELDDEDIALLVDPPGVNPANSGMMPSTSTASLDNIGNGRLNNQNGGTQALDRRKQMMPWLKRTDQAIAAQTSQAAQKQVTANQLAAQTASQPAELTIEQQLEAITSTFSALETTSLESIKHPTKAHLTAVESFDILPDETLWGNQYALFKFADNPFEGARLGGSETPLPALHTGNMALFRPLETELDENGTNRIAYFLPDDDEASLKYGHKRRMGKGVDWDIVNEADETGEETAVVTEDDQHGFRFIRDYDAIRREVRSEYVIYLDEGEDPSSPSSSQQKAAYYVPLTGHTLLRKRRARKGEPRNDYSDLGVEYWGGIEVTLGGKSFLPDEEVEGRKEDIQAIMKPPMQESQHEAVPVQQNGNRHIEDSQMQES